MSYSSLIFSLKVLAKSFRKTKKISETFLKLLRAIHFFGMFMNQWLEYLLHTTTHTHVQLTTLHNLVSYPPYVYIHDAFILKTSNPPQNVEICDANLLSMVLRHNSAHITMPQKFIPPNYKKSICRICWVYSANKMHLF